MMQAQALLNQFLPVMQSKKNKLFAILIGSVFVFVNVAVDLYNHHDIHGEIITDASTRTDDASDGEHTPLSAPSCVACSMAFDQIAPTDASRILPSCQQGLLSFLPPHNLRVVILSPDHYLRAPPLSLA